MNKKKRDIQKLGINVAASKREFIKLSESEQAEWTTVFGTDDYVKEPETWWVGVVISA